MVRYRAGALTHGAIEVGGALRARVPVGASARSNILLLGRRGTELQTKTCALTELYRDLVLWVSCIGDPDEIPPANIPHVTPKIPLEMALWRNSAMNMISTYGLCLAKLSLQEIIRVLPFVIGLVNRVLTMTCPRSPQSERSGRCGQTRWHAWPWPPWRTPWRGTA